ncbi:MAG: ribosome small subunit-dependent GTPase A [Actinomycetota bacterium]
MTFDDHNPGLVRLGWNEHFATAFKEHQEDGLLPGRVSTQHRQGYRVMLGNEEIEAAPAGRLHHEAIEKSDLPAVGDWVVLRYVPGDALATIVAVLPRLTKFSRKVAGEETNEQVLAANVDVFFLVSALNQDLNVRRIERYVAIGWNSGATPVVVLTKADLHDDIAGAVAEVQAAAPGIDIHITSDVTGEGFDGLKTYLTGNKTVAALGSSGVGKSTLINRLLGSDLLKTQGLRDDGKGRHTTSHREMVMLPRGGIIIDTPGMRELQLWEMNEGLDTAFSDIAELAESCRFADCAHASEPGCAVRAAVAEGILNLERLDSYKKLEKELAYLERKHDKKLAREEARKWKRLNVEARARTRQR